MKKSKLFGWAFVALAGLSACTDDAGDAFAGEYEIRLTSKIAHSRVTSLDYQSTQIVQEQEVGITITGAKSTHKNVAWNVGEDGKLNNTGEPVFWANGDVTITAYHPYHSTWTSTSHDFSVSTDQSNEANYRNSDLLWTMATASKTENAIPLVFEHKLSKVNVTLKSENLEDLSGAAISICGTNIATTFNPTTGKLSAASDADIQEIKAGVTTSSSYTASAIVVPQTVAYGTKFIKIVLGDRTFYYTLSTDKELRAGYSHNYTLNINEKEVTTESDKITDWEDDDNEGDVEEVLNNQIWYTSTAKVTPYNTDGFGANILSNEWDSTTGEGVITFDGEVTTIGGYAFYMCSNLQSIRIPQNVTSIKTGAFRECLKLKNVYFNSKIESIGNSAFVGCFDIYNSTYGTVNFHINSIEDWCKIDIPKEIVSGQETINLKMDGSLISDIVIPTSITSIKPYAFKFCYVTSVTMHNEIHSVGDQAFYGCSDLEEVYCKSTTPPMGGTDMFEYTHAKIYVPQSSISEYEKANGWRQYSIYADSTEN